MREGRVVLSEAPFCLTPFAWDAEAAPGSRQVTMSGLATGADALDALVDKLDSREGLTSRPNGVALAILNHR
jgi:hypothetical protein